MTAQSEVPADVLPDVLEMGLRIVFCGSAAGTASARAGAYYAGPGNKFWDVLHATGLTPRRLAPASFRTLPRYGLGLTDLCKRQSGPDTGIAMAYQGGAAACIGVISVSRLYGKFAGVSVTSTLSRVHRHSSPL